jgi:hypothetical protein
MATPVLAMLRPGDWVRFDGGDHQVVAVAGTSVRLRSAAGAEQVVLATHLRPQPPNDPGPVRPAVRTRQCEHIATEIVAAVGLDPHGVWSAVRWIGIRHAEGHIHIVATLARQDRRTVWA